MASAKLIHISDHQLFRRPVSMCPFQNSSFTSAILNKSTESGKFTCDDLCGEKESYWARVIWWYFARIKCGNIVPGWLWIVLSVPRTWLIVWFSEVVDRQNSGMSWCSYYKNSVYKHKNALCVFSWSDFVLRQPILGSRKVNSRSVLVGRLTMSLTVWETERSLFLCF